MKSPCLPLEYLPTGEKKLYFTCEIRGGGGGGGGICMFYLFCLFVLFDLILYVPSTIFHLNRDGSSWVEPVLS